MKKATLTQIKDRFGKRIDIRGKDECWEYAGGATRKTTAYNRREIYLVAHNNIPDGAYIFPTCGNKRCCNPTHQKAGTAAEASAISTRPKLDLTDIKIHMLTFVRPTEQKHRRGVIWEARCDCGNPTLAIPARVNEGLKKSCGCLKIKHCATLFTSPNSHRFPTKYEPIISLAREIWRQYKHSDKEYGCETIDFENFFALSQERCHYCNRLPSNSHKRCRDKRGGAQTSPDEPFVYNGLDRVDPSKGHTIANVVPCCWDCNRMKRDMTLEKFRAHINAIYNHFVLPKE